MFKIGDIVTLNLERKRQTDKTYRYRISVLRKERGTVMLEDIEDDFMVESMIKYMILDIDYMRKLKLKKICSKLEM